MAKDLYVGLTIGAALHSSVRSVFAGAKGSLDMLGRATTELTARHARLGEVIKKAYGPSPLLTAQRREYERLGQTLDALRLKQERLAASMARGSALKEARRDLRGQAMETAGTALVLGAPVYKSVKAAAAFEDQVKDIAITGEMSAAQEVKLGETIRLMALRTNQTQEEIARGVATLVAEGMDPAQAQKNAALLGRAATATRASFDDLARMNVNFDKVLGVKDMELAYNQAAKAGKLGSFELRDMAKWFPALGGMMKSLGVSGNEAVVNMASRLQIARRTAGSNDEAANNFKNFLSKLTSPDTQKDFDKLGINLQARLTGAASKGLDPIEAGVTVIMEQMGKSAPGAAAEMQKLAAELAKIKDPAERAAEMERRRGFIESLGQRAGLGQMFQDMQAMSYLLAEVQNRGDLKGIMDQTRAGKSASGKGVIDEDFEKRMKGSTEQFKAFKIQITEIGITLGNALLPALTDALKAVRPLVAGFAAFAQAHPGVIRGVVTLVGGLLAGKLAFIGLKYGINLLISPFVAARTVWLLASSKLLLLSRVLAGPLATGLRIGAQAVFWLGRALLMNPIGLAITAIAGGAYLIWRNWDKLKVWFSGLGATFKSFGKMMIDGLVGGITGMAGKGIEAIMKLGAAMKDKFKSFLGIRSPSRVFAGFGLHIAEGAAQGVNAGRKLAVGAVAGMALAASSAWGSPRLDAPRMDALAARTGDMSKAMASAPSAGGQVAAQAGMVVHFAPQITIQGGAAAQPQLEQALRVSFEEFQRLMRRYESDRARRAVS